MAGKAYWPAVVVVLWASGAIVLGSIGLGRAIAFQRRQRRTMVAADPQVVSLVNNLARRLSLWRKVRLVITSDPVGPLACGVLRPTLVMPVAALQGKTAGQLEPILAHELVHIRRGDTLVGLLQFLAQSLWWFHPLVWWANRRACWERERCCDEEVVARLGCRPADYARALVDVIELRQKPRSVFFYPAMRPGRIAQRLEEIMNRVGKSHRQTPFWCWAVVASAALVVLPGARPGVSAAVGKEKSGTVPAASAEAVAHSGDRPTTEIAAAPAEGRSSVIDIETAGQPRLVAAPAANNRSAAPAKNPKDGSHPWTMTQPAFIEAYATTNVYSPTSGFVAKILVDIGDAVKKGELLAKVSAPDLEAEVKLKSAMVQQAEAEVAGAAAAVRAAEIAEAAAKARIAEYEAGVTRYEAAAKRWQAETTRLKEMVAKHVMDQQLVAETQEQLDVSKAALAEACAKVESSKAAIEESQAGLTKAKANEAVARARVEVAKTDLAHENALLDNTLIRAPYDGVVAVRNANTGDYVTPPGWRDSPPLFVVMRIDVVRVRFYVPKADALLVGVGAKAVVRVPTISAVFKGTVTRTSPVLGPGETMQAEIDLPNPKGELRPGMLAHVTITVERPR